MRKEIEAKFLDINKDELRKKLKELEFELIHPERLMKRKAFHFKDDIIKKRERWARVRDEGHKITLTVKEIKVKNDINGVYESEISIDDFEEGVSLLKSLGMNETAYQETYREEWIKQNEEISIVIDTWPHLNTFLEIEGIDEELVKLYTKQLGFNFDDAMFGGVDVVYSKVYNIPPETICRVPRITFDTELQKIICLPED